MCIATALLCLVMLIMCSVGTNVKVVDKYSARLGLHESETIIGLDVDHAGLVQYPDAKCPNYAIVSERLKYITESVSNYSTLESRTVSVMLYSLIQHKNVNSTISSIIGLLFPL